MALYTIELGYKKQKRWKIPLAFLCIFVIIACFGLVKVSQPQKAASIIQPQTQAAQAKPQVKLKTPVNWPKYGQSAYGVAGSGVVASSSDSSQAVPVASLAKVITALTILKEKPLQPGQQGPTLTLSEKDIRSYEDYVFKGGAVVPIENGEQITEYQAMQAMLMPSANNMADSLARWAFGSIENYTAHANKLLAENGIKNTKVADASGFSPQTVSTASDMVQLGILYMDNPLLREIATQKEASVPFAGLIRNYNSLVNKDGIIGLKVGNTDEAGRCFLVADVRTQPKASVSVAAVIGAQSLEQAMNDAKSVLDSGNTGYDKL